MFTYRRHVNFYETDLMGIVHHSNYLRYLEESRVAWAHKAGVIKFDQPQTAAHFAVLETRVRHIKPSKFGDDLEIDVEVKTLGIRIFFQYRIRNNSHIVSLAVTEHVPLNSELKLTRLSQEIRKIIEGNTWTETWL